MGQAYTPGLKVSKYTEIIKNRLLPLKGEVKVKKGQKVKANDIVAAASLPGEVHMVKAAQKLGAVANELPQYTTVKAGDKIKKGQVIAKKKGFLGLWTETVKSPVKGSIESISEVTGQMVLRGAPTPINLLAYISGEIIDVVKDEGVVIKTNGAFVQGIFGIGGERMGHIKVLVDGPEDHATVDMLDESMKDKILVVGSYVDFGFIKKASAIGVKGIVTAGIDDRDLKRLLGYEIGVAITGNEKVSLSIVVTEGFGKIAMAHGTFNLMKELTGKFVSINGSTQIRAGVIRPEVIATGMKEGEGFKGDGEYFLKIGRTVRVIRNPYFGKLAKVVSLPPELQKLETEAMVRVVELELESGEKVLVPRANVEIIQA